MKQTELAWDKIRKHSSKRFCTIQSWTIAQGTMSNANTCGRFRCNKKVEKHWVGFYDIIIRMTFSHSNADKVRSTLRCRVSN